MRRLGLFGLALTFFVQYAVAADPARQDQPDGAGDHLQRARALIADGEHTRAIAEQTRAIALEPAAPAFKERARTWALKQQCELAVADYSRAVELDPRDQESYLGRASCLRALGRTDRAAEDLTFLLRFNTRSADVFKMRAHVRLTQGRVAEALTDLRWATDLEPRDVSIMQMLGYARFANGEYEIAADNLVRALRFRDDMRAMLYLYLARSRNGSNARAELQKNAGYLRTRSWPFPIVALYLGHGTPAEVREKASGDDQKCSANFYVGHWLQLQGRRAEGFALLKEALNTCPKTNLEYETLSAEMKLTRLQF